MSNYRLLFAKGDILWPFYNLLAIKKLSIRGTSRGLQVTFSNHAEDKKAPVAKLVSPINIINFMVQQPCPHQKGMSQSHNDPTSESI